MTKFDSLWDTHNKWIKGVWIDEVKELESADVCFSKIPGIYTNYALPKTSEISKFNLSEVIQTLYNNNHQPSVYLIEKYQELGFEEFLVEEGFEVDGNEAWMVLSIDKYNDSEVTAEIARVDESNFTDFYTISMEAFAGYDGMEEYLEMCKRSLKGELNCLYSDLVSEIYLIYDQGKPAAGGGLFYSKKGNFGYLHCASTMEEFRGKGYQTALIKHRANKVIKEDITQIYSLVEKDGQSYSNFNRLGFDCIEVSKLLVKSE